MSISLRSLLGAVVLMSSIGSAAAQAAREPAAQAPAPNAVASSPEVLRFPRLMVSFGVGSANDPKGSPTAAPMQTLSVQWLIGRHFMVEGEASRWNTEWAYQDVDDPGYGDFGTRDAWSVGSNLLYRSEPRRVSWFAGGGAFLGHNNDAVTLTVPEDCASCLHKGFRHYVEADEQLFAQGIVGADVGIAGPLRAYANVQFTTMDYAYLRFSAGVRAVALTKPAGIAAERHLRRTREAGAAPRTVTPGLAAASVGKNVRVSLTNGDRPEGEFEAVTDTEVVVRRQGQSVQYPLDRVLLVETVHHTARNLAVGGAIGGFILGWLGSCGGGDENDCWPEVGALVGGIGAGAGALIGAAIDSLHAPHHVVHAAPGRTVRLTPVVSPTKAAVEMHLSW